MKKKIITGSKLWSVAMITAMVTACSAPAATSTTANAAVSTTGTTKTVSVSEQTSVKYADLVTMDEDDTNVSWSAADSTTIKLNGDDRFHHRFGRKSSKRIGNRLRSGYLCT